MVTLQTLALALSFSAAGQTVLLDFHSDSCPPCRQMAPVVAQLEAAGYPVRKINVGHERQAAAQYGVTGVPCYILVSDGQVVDRVVGATSADRLREMFARAGYRPGEAARAGESSAPPAQAAPARKSSLTPAERAMAASVRIKINDGGGHSYGSGTIVDRQDDEALVLTCGHIFRASGGRGSIAVDLFDHRGEHAGTTKAELIRYDLDRDVGLLAIRTDRPIEPMPIAAEGFRVERGARVFSIGCDRGAPPTLHESRVTHINKYLGPANIEVAGAPADGRSGGGLFTADGKLIGVCNAADPADDEGLYAALETVQAELSAANLGFVYAPQRDQRSPAPRQVAGAADMPRGAKAPDVSLPRLLAEDAEVILIVRSKSDPQQQAEVLFIDRPTRGFLEAIATQRSTPAGPHPTSLQVPASPAPFHRAGD